MRTRLVLGLASILVTACTGHMMASGPDAQAGGDAGALDSDSGTDIGTDAGLPGDDAGPALGDGGAPSDAGTAGDAGAPPIDAGPPPIDAGPPVDVGPSSSRQTMRPLGSTDAAQGFYEYLPPGYGDGRTFPLLVFLHGIGENGNGTDELPHVLNNGPPRLIAHDAWPADRPFIVLSPQHPGGGCHSPSEIHALFEFALSHYDVDPSRVYLTGLSCGGIGAWNYLGAHLDEQIVAMVAIAGDGRGAWNAQGCELGRVAIWAFHGDADPTVSPQGTIVPTTNLMECPSPPRQDLEVTIYPGVGHDSWSRTYDLSAGHDIYAWLLAHHR